MCAIQSKRDNFDSLVGLFEHWHLEQRPNSNKPIFCFVKINSIINPCLAFQLSLSALIPGDCCPELSKHVIIVKDRQKEWRLFSSETFINARSRRDQPRQGR
jgi:hypothetical protein